jgi:predicted enzyme related to lactoylglutathione lyase
MVDKQNKQVLRGFATVNYFAADHEAARKWYMEFLGTEPYFNRPGYAEFRIGDYQAELGLIDSKYVPSIDTSATGPKGAVIYWHVDDVNATFADLLTRGAKQLEAPLDRGHGFITATVVDPFGNILGIMYNPHYVEVLGARKEA